jgi:F420H(2)-dependent quinone reductase
VAPHHVKRGFLRLLKNTINRLAVPIARSGRGPLALVRHVGRRTGLTYETPLVLARVPDGFVAELTYGPDVDWYRNITAAGRCVVVQHGVEYPVDRIEPCSTEDGLAAFGPPRSLVLRALRRHEFRVLHVEPAALVNARAVTAHEAIRRRTPPQRLVTALNPVVRAALHSPLHALLDNEMIIMHVTGRRTGHRYDIPVGFTDLGDRLVVVTQHGWRRNLRGGADVEVTRFGRCAPMHAELDEDPASVAAAVHEVMARLGPQEAQRRLGIVVDPGHEPDPAELTEAIRDFDLALITLTDGD